MFRLLYALRRLVSSLTIAHPVLTVRATLFIFVTLLFFSSLFQILSTDTKVLLLSKSTAVSCKPDRPLPAYDASCASRHDEAIIPNVVHFVYILSDPVNGVFPFKFTHFLSVYSAWHYWQPDVMYLHTNVDANSSAVRQARSGKQGKWAKRLLNMPGLVINTVPTPLFTDYGKTIDRMEHRSDFVRVKAVHDFGGVYIDMDVHALRDIEQLRKAGYQCVAGRQGGGQLNSGTFLASKGSKATKMWIESMHRVYDGRWTTHSNEAFTTVGKELESSPCEMLILEQTAFAPIGWKWFDGERLFGEHYEATDLEWLESDGLPTNSLADHGVDNKAAATGYVASQISWALDWSCTYLLHAFSRQMPKISTPDNEISPRYIAQRRSLFARAVYPVIRDMYKTGVVDKRDFE
ncbi:hypothetical protein PWT90_01166 [Aphanocladium album]|nr:hypothetical protein PWT90_01166 [Aphanocladium album]